MRKAFRSWTRVDVRYFPSLKSKENTLRRRKVSSGVVELKTRYDV